MQRTDRTLCWDRWCTSGVGAMIHSHGCHDRNFLRHPWIHTWAESWECALSDWNCCKNAGTTGRQKGITWTFHLCTNPTVKKSRQLDHLSKMQLKKLIQIHTGGFCAKLPIARCFAVTIIVQKTFTMLEHCGIKSVLRKWSLDKMKLQTSFCVDSAQFSHQSYLRPKNHLVHESDKCDFHIKETALLQMFLTND